MLDEGKRKDLHQTDTTSVLMFLRIELVLPPSHIRLQIRPDVDEFESTFSPGEGRGIRSSCFHPPKVEISHRLYREIATSGLCPSSQ